MRQLTLPTLFSNPPRRTVSPRQAEAGVVSRQRETAHRRTGGRRRAAPLRRRVPRSVEAFLRGRVAIPVAAIALTLLLSGGLVVHGGGFAAVGNKITARLVAWSGSLGIAVRAVLVEGRGETPAADILAALQVRYGTPLFAFSPEQARERLLDIGWVAEARVERRLPGTIFVDLEERRPAAIWQHLGEFALVDASGAVIGGEDIGRYADLRVVVGADAPAHFAELFEILGAEPDLAPQVAAAVRVGGRRWNLQFEQGTTVLLPDSGVAEAWALLARLARERALLDRDIARIDLRNPGRMIVRLSPGAVQSRRERDV